MRAVNLLPKEERYGGAAARRSQWIIVVPVVAGCSRVALRPGSSRRAARSRTASRRAAGRQAQLSSLPIVPVDRTGAIRSTLTAEQQPRVTAVAALLAPRRVGPAPPRGLAGAARRRVAHEPVREVARSWRRRRHARRLRPGAATGFTLNAYTYSQDGVARACSARSQVLPDLTNVQLQTEHADEDRRTNVVHVHDPRRRPCPRVRS